MKVTVRIIHF